MQKKLCYPFRVLPYFFFYLYNNDIPSGFSHASAIVKFQIQNSKANLNHRLTEISRD